MLIVYDLAPLDKTYEVAVEAIHAMSEVRFSGNACGCLRSKI